MSDKVLSATILGLLVPLGLTVFTGCEEDEPPPPLPAAETEDQPTAPLVLEAEDAGEEEEDAGKKVVGGPFKPKSNLTACCNALQQNAASAPPPTNAYMIQAAALCHGLAQQGKDKASAGAAILGALKGANMPAQCQ